MFIYPNFAINPPGVKHGSFMWIVTGLFVPLFLSSSEFLNLYIRSVVRLKVL